MDAAHVLDLQLLGVQGGVEIVAGQMAESVVEAKHLETVVDRLDGGGPDHPVDPRRRPAAHQNTHRRLLHIETPSLIRARNTHLIIGMMPTRDNLSRCRHPLTGLVTRLAPGALTPTFVMPT